MSDITVLHQCWWVFVVRVQVPVWLRDVAWVAEGVVEELDLMDLFLLGREQAGNDSAAACP